MDDTDVSSPQGESSPGAGRPWLLLIHQLPSEPAYLRVKVLRRMKALGAVALKNSVYVLPDTEAAREDFHWLRKEIVEEGGVATLALTRFLAGAADGDLQRRFSSERDEEYAQVRSLIDEAAAGDDPAEIEVERLRVRLQAIRGRDYFGARGSFAAFGALEALERRIRGGTGEEVHAMTDRPVAATWVTRAGARIDRLASAWLIQRFIDPDARFKYVAPDGYRPERGELRFDMFEGEFTHEGDRCTFEVLLGRFGLEEPALVAISEIVHDIDVKDERFGRVETPGIASLVDGVAAAHPSDDERRAAALPIFDALLARFRSEQRLP